MKFLRKILRLVRRSIFILVLLFLLQRSTILTSEAWNAISFAVSEHQFDYIGWEIGALWSKVNQTLFGYHPFMTEADQVQFVRDYMAQLGQWQTLNARINAIYVDPEIADPDAETQTLRAERDRVRHFLNDNQALAEAILEGQVANILIEEGFGFHGQLLPPMAMRFFQVPNLLVVSPRDEIRFDISINLNALPVDDISQLEDQIDEQFDVSSLIVPLGGIALYPAMILESSSIAFVIETFAHEWLHHYLYFFPLGLQYFTSSAGFGGETRIINETTADIFGKELARLVLERYYPDIPPPQLPPLNQNARTVVQPDPNAFDFGYEMNETRVTVDNLLADGRVEAAEAYMEERRALFVANGFTIRKLNQAYFAFYGGYQGGDIPGVAGEDPIGRATRTILETSDGLHEFVIRMRGITSREQLLVEAEK